MDNHKDIVIFLQGLRDSIIKAFESLEPNKQFIRKDWEHHGGGGGQISILRGDIFEKAAVNWSGVSGNNLPFQEDSGPFFATGISLITHMHNPHAPTVHMNIRYIVTEKKSWLGGGYDLTPMGLPYQEDTEHFHAVAKKTLDAHGSNLYETFSQQAKEYFFIPHRKKERGVGGIFFDYLDSGDKSRDLAMWKDVGATFLDAIMPIYTRRIATAFSKEDKLIQLQQRSHYVEFNLLYDRGTKFGFLSGGNPEAILCSMPPLAAW